MVKLSKIDSKMMYAIHKEKAGISCYAIARKLSIDVAYVHRRLRRLVKMENEIKEIFDKILKTDVPMELAKLVIGLGKLKKNDEKLFAEIFKKRLGESEGEIIRIKLKPIIYPYFAYNEKEVKELEEINKNPELKEARDYVNQHRNNEVN